MLKTNLMFSMILVLVFSSACGKKEAATAADPEITISSDPLTIAQGTWYTQCMPMEGTYARVEFKVEGTSTSIRFRAYENTDTDCSGDYTVMSSNSGEFVANSTLVKQDLGAPERVMAYLDDKTGVDQDDYGVIYINSVNSASILMLNSDTSPGSTWNDWENFSESGHDVSDFLADPTHYSAATQLTRIE